MIALHKMSMHQSYTKMYCTKFCVMINLHNKTIYEGLWALQRRWKIVCKNACNLPYWQHIIFPYESLLSHIVPFLKIRYGCKFMKYIKKLVKTGFIQISNAMKKKFVFCFNNSFRWKTVNICDRFIVDQSSLLKNIDECLNNAFLELLSIAMDLP